MNIGAEDIIQEQIEFETEYLEDPGGSSAPRLFLPTDAIEAAVDTSTAGASERPPVNAAERGATGGGVPTLPRQTRRSRYRYRSRPLAPLDEARRILSQVEKQRAAADAAQAEALKLIGQNLGRIANALETYLSN
ncbi:uncharacterized protein LOC126380006 [Pectinophora gossypiella]|uniref:uncharacterized protein LOC126380006 n=1 Tax=Pectinophora gossypiella TaxID=13191 RepID=UPI00214F0151|nr:uncharacterized protein LOC126380006 [Pectinophora gossypiella]